MTKPTKSGSGTKGKKTVKDLTPKSGAIKGGATPRDAASGLATGKRTHKPFS